MYLTDGLGEVYEYCALTPMNAPRQFAVGFTRKPLLRHPDVLIESICEYCGLSIIASAPESLDRDERERREECRDLPKASD